ncbi:MAG: hypothetical protein JXA30_22595 [Deltaproteobacteria bacterium]|nr:hypothetical protein [Deltaproteobacteria bacterium]
MNTIGLDIGNLFTKAVLMRGDDLAAASVVRTSGDIPRQAHALIREIVDEAGLMRDRIDCLGVTGAGAEAIKDADFSEDTLACLAAAAVFYLSDVRTVIDLGGQSITSIQIDPDGEVIGFLRNDKCAAGSGRLLEVMSEKLNLTVADLDRAVARAAKQLEISNQCGVFAESEVITHINNGESVESVMAGVCSSVARIVVAQARKSNPIGRFTITGGVAKIAAVTRIVHEKLGGEFCPFPADPQLATAIGAALLGDPE